MQSVYRFWSMDPVYKRIIEVVQKKGAVAPGGDGLHRFARLYKGMLYLFGKAEGHLYPSGSHFTANPTISFPAVLYITAETSEQLRQIEKHFGLDKVPDYRRRFPHIQEPWLPPLGSIAYHSEEAYLYSQFNPKWGDLLECDRLRHQWRQEVANQ